MAAVQVLQRQRLEHFQHYCNPSKDCHSERSEESPHFARSEIHYTNAD